MFKTSSQCRVELVSHTNTIDSFPCSAARVSFGNEDKTGEDVLKDTKLMRYLAEHEHLTPFEYQHATFLLEVPLFIRSQIMRHRAFSYNEISRRYTEENIEFWEPELWRKQSKSNKQASTENIAPYELYNYQSACAAAYTLYEEMLENGVCREQARAVLPQSTLTKFFMGGNLRSWAHFIRLRTAPEAQKEVRIPAVKIQQALSELWPESMAALTGEW